MHPRCRAVNEYQAIGKVTKDFDGALRTLKFQDQSELMIHDIAELILYAIIEHVPQQQLGL